MKLLMGSFWWASKKNEYKSKKWILFDRLTYIKPKQKRKQKPNMLSFLLPYIQTLPPSLQHHWTWANLNCLNMHHPFIYNPWYLWSVSINIHLFNNIVDIGMWQIVNSHINDRAWTIYNITMLLWVPTTEIVSGIISILLKTLIILL